MKMLIAPLPLPLPLLLNTGFVHPCIMVVVSFGHSVKVQKMNYEALLFELN